MVRTTSSMPYICTFAKGGRSANKVRKPKNCGLTNNFLDFGPSANVTLCECSIYGHNIFLFICGFVICEIAICGPKLFADLKLLQKHNAYFSLDIL
jgi:hypothetical protein